MIGYVRNAMREHKMMLYLTIMDRWIRERDENLSNSSILCKVKGYIAMGYTFHEVRNSTVEEFSK